MLCSAAPSWAGKYAYGDSFVRLGRQWTEGAPREHVVSAEDAATSRDEAAYLEQMSRIEQVDGPYAADLSEPLVGLGRYYSDRGDVTRAQQVYRRALHVVRINDGLYSHRQIPVVRAQLEAYRNSGELRQLDGLYDYYFRLFGAGQPPYTELRLRAALGYLRWQREALRLEMDGDNSVRMLDLYHRNAQLIQSVAEQPSLDPRWHSELALSQLKNLYLLQDSPDARIENKGLAPSTSPFVGQWDEKDMAKVRLQRMQRGAMSLGKEVLEDVITRHGDEMNAEELAHLYLAWADWYQWQGKSGRAGQQYREVVRLLQQGGREDLLQQWLGEPVELPDNGAFWQPQPGPVAQPDALTVSYDVTAEGKVRNITAEVDPEQESALSNLARKLRYTRFRPRWASGAPEATYQLSRRYVLLN